jgi:hypothetical protein
MSKVCPFLHLDIVLLLFEILIFSIQLLLPIEQTVSQLSHVIRGRLELNTDLILLKIPLSYTLHVCLIPPHPPH